MYISQIELWIPYFDVETRFGYTWTMAYQILLMIYAVFSLLAVDMFFMYVEIFYLNLKFSKDDLNL